MKDYRLTQALGGISDDLLLEAAEVKKKRSLKGGLLRVVAVAAILAILLTALLWPADENYVTGPGLLVVRAYAEEQGTITEENSIILEEGIEFPNASWSLLSNQLGFPVTLSVPQSEYDGMKISFEISVSAGSLLQPPYCGKDEHGNFPDGYAQMKSSYLGNHFTVGNNMWLFYRPEHYIFDEDKREYYHPHIKDYQSLVEIIIYADKYIVGYAVIEFYEMINEELKDKFIAEGIYPYGVVYAKVLEIRSFPKVDGRYQKVSQEYVEAQFQRIRLACEKE